MGSEAHALFFNEGAENEKDWRNIRSMFTELQEEYGYSEQDAMLVLKDIMAHEYMDNRKKWVGLFWL